MKNAIEEAVALAEHIPSTEIEQLSEQLALVSAKMEHEEALLRSLLGVEETSKLILQTDLATLKSERSQLEKRITQLEKRNTLGSRYLQLSMEPLKWRDKDGWPRLVVFSLDSPNFEIGTRRRDKYSEWQKWIVPKLPKAITTSYKDVFETLQRDVIDKYESTDLRYYEISSEISCCFEGLIPDDVKRKIVGARELGLFENIFLIAEPKGFEINETTVVAPKQDPLVVGFDGSQLWLIAEFDTTPVEEAMIFSLPDTKGEPDVRIV